MRPARCEHRGRAGVTPGQGVLRSLAAETARGHLTARLARGGKTRSDSYALRCLCDPRQPARSSGSLAGASLPRQRSESAEGDATGAGLVGSSESRQTGAQPRASFTLHNQPTSSHRCQHEQPLCLLCSSFPIQRASRCPEFSGL